MQTHEVHNRGTRYIAHVSTDETRRYFALVSGWSGNCGEWIALPIDETEVAWSYLAEKCPALEDHGGDKPGWVMLFAEAGVRVFGGGDDDD